MSSVSPAPRLSVNQFLDLQEVADCLIADGAIPRDHVGRLRTLIERRRSDIHPLTQIADLEIPKFSGGEEVLTVEALTQWLAERTRMPVYRIDPMSVKVEDVTRLVSQAYAQERRILPVEVFPDRVIIATSEPMNLHWRSDLSQILRREIEVVLVNPKDITRYQKEFYGVSRSVERATNLKMRADADKVLNFEQLLELGRSSNLSADDQHVVFIVDWLLQYAFDQRASDIHLEPRRDLSNVRFRIDGSLHTVHQLPTPVMGAVTARIKILGRMDVAEKRRPQDGRLKTRSPNGREIELRLSTMPTAFGEKCVMRIFDPDIVNLSYTELGFSDKELATWTHFVDRPHGIVLVTGPTGSGKTTTLYATLKHLARPEINVCTIEDPIEMVAPEFNQMQVQRAIDVDFAQGVRTLLRQDPDIIMIGEIRDLDTAHMAVQASLTGHLVLSTLHTNNAASAITRLLDLGVPHYLISGTLVGIVAQRLVRTLCSQCKRPGPINEKGWQRLTQQWNLKVPAKTMEPVGCEACRDTGYRGRTAIYEMLTCDDDVNALIDAETDLHALQTTAVRNGMRPLAFSAARKIAAGMTTVDEVLRVVPPPVRMKETP